MPNPKRKTNQQFVRLNPIVTSLTAIEDSRANIREILGESLIFSLDLVGQLTGMAEHHHMDLSVHGGQLMQGSQYKHSGLSHS